MNDYIKREDAIKAAQDMATAIPLPKTVVKEVFNKIPPAEVRESIKSTWHYDGKFYYKCRQCGYNASFRFNFCPNCGAQMER